MSKKTNQSPSEKRVTIIHSNVNLEIATKYRERGKAVIVFLHGLGCSGTSFVEVWNCEELAAYSILCIDYVGHGKSSASDSFSYSIEAHAHVCSAVLSAYSDRPIHIVGHSLGGAVALLLPDPVRESIVSFANVEGNLNAEDCVFGSRRAADRSLVQFVADVLPEFRRSSATWLEAGLDVVNETAFHRTSKSLVEWSDQSKLLDAFHLWQVKKAYFYGSQNSGHYTVGSVKGIDCFEISDAGHFVMNDNPEEFYLELGVFLSGPAVKA